mgnify:FL=1
MLLIDPYAPSAGSLSTTLGWLSSSIHAAGHEVFVLSLNSRRIADYEKVLPDLVNRYAPKMIGITVVCTTYTSALRMVDHFSKYFQGYIVLGGAQMSFERENALKENERVDFGIVGEGEEALVELIEHLENGKDLNDVQGLIYGDNGEVKVNPQRKWIVNLNKLPFPDYRLFGLKRVPPKLTYRISTSRGCPFQCTYCNPRTMQGKWRTRDFNLAIEELKFARDHFDIRRFDICEPVFNLTCERVIEFCELLLKENINMPWTCNSGIRADRITDDMIKVMKRAGFYDVKIGVETLSPKVFSTINKGETIDEIVHAVEVVKRNGLQITGSFIIGLPGATYESDMESFKYARKLGFDEMYWSFLVPYPGTPAYNWVLEHGKLYYDYREAHQYLGQIVINEKVRVAFETPEYPLSDRIKAMEKISWMMKRSGIGQMNSSAFGKAWKTIYNLARYDPWNVYGNLLYVGQGFVSEFLRKRKPEGQEFLQFEDLQKSYNRAD